VRGGVLPSCGCEHAWRRGWVTHLEAHNGRCTITHAARDVLIAEVAAPFVIGAGAGEALAGGSKGVRAPLRMAGLLGVSRGCRGGQGMHVEEFASVRVVEVESHGLGWRQGAVIGGQWVFAW